MVKGCGSLNVNLYDNNYLTDNEYQWNFGDAQSGNNNISTESNPIHFYNQIGMYDVSVTVTSEFGCSSTQNYPQFIQVFNVPMAAFRVDRAKVSLDDPMIRFTDESFDADTWFWDFGEPLSGIYNTSNQRNPSHSYSETGIQTVWLYVENIHGCKDTASKQIEVLDYFTFYAPNAFTPNGDGINDEFLGKGKSIATDGFKMTIYNRWGERVFESDDISKGWDGTNKSGLKASPEGVYTWIAVMKDMFGMEHNYKGSVTIIQ